MLLSMIAPATTGLIGNPLLVRDHSLTEEWVIRWHDTAGEMASKLRCPELAIYELSDISVMGPELYIVHQDGNLERSDGFLIDFAQNSFDANPNILQKYANLTVRSVDEPVVLYQGHGVNVYGHVLVEMLPRLALLRFAGFDLKELKFLIRSDTVQWHKDLLNSIFQISPEQLIGFDPARERVAIRKAIVPTLPRGRGGIHPAATGLFDALCPGKNIGNGAAKLNVLIERPTVANPASFIRRLSNFENLAQLAEKFLHCRRIEPSRLDFQDQVGTFRNLKTVVGEYGSALHNIVFSHQRPVCICIGHINMLQSTLCALRGAEVVYLTADILKENAQVDEGKFEKLLESVIEKTNERSLS
jgi:Glycosyltransferase 61